MTMPRGVSRALFTGNGQAVEFPFFFKVFEEDQLSVLVTSPDGVTTEAAGWSAQLDESGGTLTYLHNGAPLPGGWKLAIVRDMPFVQEVDLITGTRFDPEVIETALDVATAERQQLLERLARAVVVEPTDEAGPEALLADIRDARASAASSATGAAANANAAAESARAAAGSAAIATEAREAACTCAGEAKAARDVAIAQTEAANTLMEAELAKVNAIVAANRTDQQAAVTAARHWAEKAPDIPVDYDEEGNPRYSARHWAENAQKIAIEPPTAERRGSIRVGAGLRLEIGENGEKDVLALSPDGVTTGVGEDGLLFALGSHLLLNSEEWITESGTWVAPVSGWYAIWMIGGGQGGVTYIEHAGWATLYGGRSGSFKEVLVYLEAGREIPVTIGSGGINNSTGNQAAAMGSATVFGELTTADSPQFFPSTMVTAISLRCSCPGAGIGGGWSQGWNAPDPAFYGGGGATYLANSSTAANRVQQSSPGRQGAVRVRWHDPARAAGPAPLKARRMASRAAGAPVVVNLYEPETGQGSVWNEADAEAKLAEGLIREEAWRAVRAAKAEEERAAWLASPETGAERFEMLRAARDAKLKEYDAACAQLAREARLGLDVAERRAAWDEYAQALCALPQQEGAPWDGGGELTPWPAEPRDGAASGGL